MADLSVIGGMASDFAFTILGIVVIGALAVAAWFAWDKFLNFNIKIYFYQRRGDWLIPSITQGRFEKTKDGRDVLNIKNQGTFTSSVGYDYVGPGDILSVYSPNKGEVRPMAAKIMKDDKGEDLPMFKPMMDETMRHTYASTLEKIWLMTNPNNFLQQWGSIIFLIVAAVLLMVILAPAMDATNKAAEAMTQTAAAFKDAAASLAQVHSGAAIPTAAAPPADIYAPPIFLVVPWQ